MALIPCPGCGRQISEYARVCPGCGFALLPNREEQKAAYPPARPEGFSAVLPWAGLFFGLGALAAAFAGWQVRESELLLGLGLRFLAIFGVSACAAGAVFRSRAVLLAAAVAWVLTAILGFLLLRVVGVLAVLACLPLAVFLLLSVIRRGERR